MKDKIKNYSFWVGLSGAVVVLVEAIGRAVGFIPNGQLINDIIMAVAGVLVVFGVVSMPTKTNQYSENPFLDVLSEKEEPEEEKKEDNKSKKN